MAKNDPLEQASLVMPPEGKSGGPSIKDVQYLRKDTHLLMQGVWYMTLPCPYHGTPTGLVDEEVSWEEAKTPHHAGVVAELRHRNCAAADEALAIYSAGLQEIEAAKELRDNQARNVAYWRERVAAHASVLEADPKNPLRARELAVAEARLKRHEHGMLEAEKRVANTAADNSK